MSKREEQPGTSRPNVKVGHKHHFPHHDNNTTTSSNIILKKPKDSNLLLFTYPAIIDLFYLDKAVRLLISGYLLRTRGDTIRGGQLSAVLVTATQ